jgi:hypothetical protein
MNSLSTHLHSRSTVLPPSFRSTSIPCHFLTGFLTPLYWVFFTLFTLSTHFPLSFCSPTLFLLFCCFFSFFMLLPLFAVLPLNFCSPSTKLLLSFRSTFALLPLNFCSPSSQLFLSFRSTFALLPLNFYSPSTKLLLSFLSTFALLPLNFCSPSGQLLLSFRFLSAQLCCPSTIFLFSFHSPPLWLSFTFSDHSNFSSILTHLSPLAGCWMFP